MSVFNQPDRWTNGGDNMQQYPMDLHDVVNLLAALGFHVRLMDACLPEETSLLKDKQGGIRVVVTCTHSGIRYYLEQPLNTEMCKCPKYLSDIGNNTLGDGISSTTSKELDPKRSVISPLSNEQKRIITPVINYLIRMVHETNEITSSANGNENQIEQSSDRKLQVTKTKGASSMSDFPRNPALIVSSPQDNNSPTRYRSLDTLTSQCVDNQIPEPGCLQSSYKGSDSHVTSAETLLSKFHSTNIDDDNRSLMGDSHNLNKAVSLINTSVNNLLNAISLIQTNIAYVSSDSVFVKSPKVLKKKIMKPPTSSQTSNMKNRAISSPNLSTHKNTNIVKQTKLGIPSKKANSSTCLKSVCKLGNASSKPQIKRNNSTSALEEAKLKIPLRSDLKSQIIKGTKTLYTHNKTTTANKASNISKKI